MTYVIQRRYVDGECQPEDWDVFVDEKNVGTWMKGHWEMHPGMGSFFKTCPLKLFSLILFLDKVGSRYLPDELETVESIGSIDSRIMFLEDRDETKGMAIDLDVKNPEVIAKEIQDLQIVVDNRPVHYHDRSKFLRKE